jgi:23S rRNA A2030 N6-methylase RlmJ
MKKFRKPACRESPFHFFDGAELIQQQLAKLRNRILINELHPQQAAAYQKN